MLSALIFSFLISSDATTPPVVPMGEGVSKAHELWLFGGAEIGYAYMDDHSAINLNKHGFHFQGFGLLTYYWPKWLVETGMGWMLNDVQGSSGVIIRERVRTHSPFAEVGGRYRIDDRWQVGPRITTYFGTDLSFGSVIATEDVVAFAGASLIYEIPYDRLAIRLGLSGLTDISVSGRQMYIIMGGVQLGFTPFRNRIRQPAVDVKKDADEFKPQLAIVVGSEIIQFDFNSDKLDKKSAAFVKEVGAFLAMQPNEWTKLRVEGHTDNIGSFNYNQKLSERRSQSVKKALIEAGIQEDRLVAKGYSFLRPLDSANTQEARDKNRRVEFAFESLKKPKMIEEELGRLRIKYLRH